MATLQPVANLARLVWPRTLHPTRSDREAITSIREQASQYRALTDTALGEQTDVLREAVRGGTQASEEQIVTTGFALVSEAARRTIGIEYYDVQLLAGLALSRRTAAEMQTGEGKTFVAALPAYLFALASRGVHVMTSNAYLAERDCELLAPLFGILGMTVGVSKPQAEPDQKSAAYACDVTYGPGYEFGFDYLRDQAALLDRPQLALGEQHRRLMRGEETPAANSIQRGHAFAIVDEIDCVLLDEATSPLILSAGARAPAADPGVYLQARDVADQLSPDDDYVVQETIRVVRLTNTGAQKAMGFLKQTPGSSLQRPWETYVEHALRVELFMKRDVHYVVDDEKILLVDESTGRIFADRSLRDGLHQAIEAKEEVPILAEQQPLARISRQRYLQLYEGICGMTGTASGSEREFWHFYRLPVVRIPLRRESRRTALSTRCFAGASAKWQAIAEEIQRLHQTAQPILIGARTIENSIALAEQLEARAIPYQLLNGRQDADEADIVARAGNAGSITIATNMAGRGTDIKLGPDVPQLGGLHVIVSEPHASARIDRQLVGRCARQGDPGSHQMFISAEDELIVRHAADFGRRIQRAADAQGEALLDAGPELSKAQGVAEREAYSKRRQLFSYDDWLDETLAKLVKEDE